ncbi:hypothetical protein H1R20_g15034, partial [Candolleomyces eurysporus]
MTRHIAVLGGGLSGLSSAFHLARRCPGSRITLIERNKELGGWVRSRRVELKEQNATALLEAGPRTLRPNARSVLELIHLLGLENQIITVPKSSPAAKSRFLYIPPSYGERVSGLQRIPDSLWSLMKSPLTRILAPAILQEALKLGNRPQGSTDESVDAFLRRRFGADFAQIFGSALIHGIYAADSRQISVRSAFAAMWDAEERGWGSLIRGSLFPSKKQTQDAYETGTVPHLMSGASVFSFRDGLQTLTTSLEEYLKRQSRVEILRGSTVSSVAENGGHLKITLSSGDSVTPSHLISALPTPHLYKLLAPSFRSLKPFEYLIRNPTSSVHVVNIVFPGHPSTIHPAGFGYLVPRPPQGYPASPAEGPGILGTVFDSCSVSAQDTSIAEKPGNGDAEFTKLTVMVGGPYPVPQIQAPLSSSDVNASSLEAEYVQRILKKLSIHLSRRLPSPIYWRIHSNVDCIPTLLPGHLERMTELGECLSSEFGDQFQIVGAGVGGVSVGDCVEGGRAAALALGEY